jgi:surface polysaccharide O-acyltransferase-like enzyme
MMLVVGVHVNIHTQVYLDNWWPGGMWSTSFYGLAVPAFFMLSGLVLALGSPFGTPIDAPAFARRKLVSLIIPFLLWNLIGTSVAAALGDTPTLGIAVVNLLTGHWQLYFVFALLQLFAIFLWLHPWLNERRLSWVVAGAAAVSLAFYALSSALFWTGVQQDDFFEVKLNRLFAPWALYFFTGVLLAHRPRLREALARRWWMVVLLAAALYAPMHLEFRAEEDLLWDAPLKQFAVCGLAYQLVGALALLATIARLAATGAGEKVVRVLARGAPDSLGVYLCHTAVLSLLYAGWRRLGLSETPGLEVPALWVLTAAVSLGLTRLGRRLGMVGRMLFAVRGTPRQAKADLARRAS